MPSKAPSARAKAKRPPPGAGARAVKKVTKSKPKAKASSVKPSLPHLAPPPVSDQVQSALAWLDGKSSKRVRDEMGPRYGIIGPSASKALGVSMANLKQLAKQLGHSHELAAALWATDVYEARMVASMVDEADKVTAGQMDRWAKDFDNWAICDTVCFKLFDRAPHAMTKVEQWAERNDEFVKRAAFALLACVALHDKDLPNETFLKSMPLIEAAASDERNFVKKGVSWALRAIGLRNSALRSAAKELATRLADAPGTAGASRWVGKDALRHFSARSKASAQRSSEM